MNYEKQTYLNTEQLNELYRKETVLTASVPSARKVGGLRFLVGAAQKVRLELTFPALNGTYTPYLDGKPVMTKAAPRFTAEIPAEKGEHIFEFVSSASHGGAILRVSGIGIREGGRYLSVVGGYYTDSQTVVYMKRGDRNAEKVLLESGALGITALDDALYDACLYYDKGNASYTSSLLYIRSDDPAALIVNSGQESTITLQGLRSAAICDGQALPSGHDALIAYVGADNVLHFCTAVRNGGVSTSAATVSNVKRVLSAMRGTTLLVQDGENVWRAYVFGATGEKSITVGGSTLYYTVLLLAKSECCPPTADLECPSMTHRFYYKDAKGVLVKRGSQGQAETVGYADAYCPGKDSGIFIQDNEIAMEA